MVIQLAFIDRGPKRRRYVLINMTNMIFFGSGGQDDMNARMVSIEGKELVILSRAEFDDLMEKAGVMPPLPRIAKDGSVPALEFARADIAREVVRRRISAGITQQELAKRVGVRPETVSRLEAGKHLPRTETIERIDRALPALSATEAIERRRRRPTLVGR
jgi:DNA-binding XRE family transcriptional regulator